MLFILSAITPSDADLQRLVNYDYLLIHSGDVSDGPPSLHPAVPFRGSELLIKRDLVRAGLDLMCARELVEKRMTPNGITFSGSELTNAFTGLLRTSYARDLAARATWLAKRFSQMPDSELSEFMSTNIGRWGAEFDRLSALRELEL